MQDPNCLFCEIVSRGIPARVIYEDEHVLIFLDIKPRTPGHAMVIPKAHVPNLLELPDKEVGPLFAGVQRIARRLSERLHPDGITIGINQGRASGQEVDHLHVHVMPRWHGDGGGSIQSVVDNAPKESVDEILKKLIG